jgi:hypothetical protein
MRRWSTGQLLRRPTEEDLRMRAVRTFPMNLEFKKEEMSSESQRFRCSIEILNESV